MIDREAAGGSLFRKNSAGSGGNNNEPIGISNKTIVYLVTIILIAILCVVYGMQLRDARKGGQEQPAAAVTADTAQETQAAEPAAEAPAETPAEAPAETPAEAPEEAPAETPEQIEEAPEETAEE